MQSPQPLLRNQKPQNHPRSHPTLYNSQVNHPNLEETAELFCILHSYPPVLGWVLSNPLAWINSHWAALPVFYPRPLTLTTATILIFPTWQLHVHSPAYNVSTPLTLSIEKKKRSLAECIKILTHPPTHRFRVTQHPWTWELPTHAVYFPICLGCSSCQTLLPLLSSACQTLTPPLGLKHHFLFRIMSSSPVLFRMLSTLAMWPLPH